MSDGFIGHSVVEEYGPDIAQPLVCFRAFVLPAGVFPTLDGLIPGLPSPTKGYIWGKDNTATCREYIHDAPNEHCMCGLYGYHSVDLAKRYNNYNKRCPVVAIIQCWGRTFLHSKGLRTEHARIAAIAPNDEISELPKSVRLWAAENNITIFKSTGELADVIEDYGVPSQTLIPKTKRALAHYGLGPIFIALNVINTLFILLHIYPH